MIVTLSDFYSDQGVLSVASDAGSGDIQSTKDYTAAQNYLSGGMDLQFKVDKAFDIPQTVNYISICTHNISSANVINVEFFVNGASVGIFTPDSRTHNILLPFADTLASNISIEINKSGSANRVLIGFVACGFSRVVPNDGEHSGFNYGHLFTPTEVRTVTNDRSQPTAGVTWTMPVKHNLSLPNISRNIVKNWWFDFTDAAKRNGWFIMLAEDSQFWTASLCFDVRDKPRKAHGQTRGLVDSSLMFTGDSGV